MTTITIKIISIPIGSPAGVAEGKAVVDWLELRDVGEKFDGLFTTVLVTCVGANRGVVRLELLGPTNVAIICWLEVDGNEELEAPDSIGKETELSVWLETEDVPEDTG